MKSIVLPCSKTIQLRRLQGTDNPGKNEMRFQMMGTITKEIVDNKKVFQRLLFVNINLDRLLKMKMWVASPVVLYGGCIFGDWEQGSTIL